jgi:hypothetical protein
MPTIGIRIWWIGHLLEEFYFDLYKGFYFFNWKNGQNSLHFKGKEKEKEKQVARFVY